MRFTDLERVAEGKHSRFVTTVADTRGEESFELTIAGPERLLHKAFAETEIEIEINPEGDQEWPELQRAREEERQATWEQASFEQVDDLFKGMPPELKQSSTMFVGLRRVRGHGTSFFVSFAPFFLAGGRSVVASLPWVCTCFGIVTPASGDQDLYLHLYSPWTWPVRASAKGGIFTDVVTYSQWCTALTQFVPFFRVFGWSTGVCGTFAIGGTDRFG